MPWSYSITSFPIFHWVLDLVLKDFQVRSRMLFKKDIVNSRQVWLFLTIGVVNKYINTQNKTFQTIMGITFWDFLMLYNIFFSPQVKWIVINSTHGINELPQKLPRNLKELRNCVLRIIRVWSVFCSVQVYISLHFLPIFLVKPGFRLFCFSIFGFWLFVSLL